MSEIKKIFFFTTNFHMYAHTQEENEKKNSLLSSL